MGIDTKLHINSETLRVWLTTDEVAILVGVDDATVRSWRKRGNGPPFIRVGPKICRYPYDGLMAWLESRIDAPEAE